MGNGALMHGMINAVKVKGLYVITLTLGLSQLLPPYGVWCPLRCVSVSPCCSARKMEMPSVHRSRRSWLRCLDGEIRLVDGWMETGRKGGRKGGRVGGTGLVTTAVEGAGGKLGLGRPEKGNGFRRPPALLIYIDMTGGGGGDVRRQSFTF
jgi:hypothetical protein